MAEIIEPGQHRQKACGLFNSRASKAQYVRSMSIISTELAHDGLLKEQQKVIKAVSTNSDLTDEEVLKIVHASHYEDVHWPTQGRQEAIAECEYLIDYLESALALATSAHSSSQRTQTTATAASEPVSEDEEDELTYCSCNRPYDEEMVACDNPLCEIEWYHLRCVGLDYFPSDEWHCPRCREISA